MKNEQFKHTGLICYIVFPALYTPYILYFRGKYFTYKTYQI